MAATTAGRLWDRFRDRVREWIEAVGEALAPEPEPVPIPVHPKGRPAAGRKRR